MTIITMTVAMTMMITVAMTVTITMKMKMAMAMADFWVLEASVPQLMTGSLFPPSSDLLDSFNVLSYTTLHSSHPTFIFF